MQEFVKLRAVAKKIRNETIEVARLEYHATMQRINDLERELLNVQPVRTYGVGKAIDGLIPIDKEFTAPDILKALATLDPSRDWSEKTVGNHLFKLRNRAVIRRIRKAASGRPAIYVCAAVPNREFEDMPLVDAVTVVLGKRSMTVLEIAVALREAEYKTAMRGKRFMDAICAALRAEPGRFWREREKWCSAGSAKDIKTFSQSTLG